MLKLEKAARNIKELCKNGAEIKIHLFHSFIVRT